MKRKQIYFKFLLKVFVLIFLNFIILNNKMQSLKCKLGNICDALLKYYNTSILNHPDMNPALKEACYAEAKDCADKNFARQNKTLQRTVLAELILSHQNQQDQSADPATKKPYADFIGGPKSLTLQWSSYYKKLIYIFGEEHWRYHDCPKIDGKITMVVEDYIKQLYQNGDMFTDLYIETGAFFKNTGQWIEHRVTRLAELRKKFTTCLLNANSDENCRKGRVHYIDIRHIFGGEDHIKYGNIRQYVNEYLFFANGNKKEYIDGLNNFFADIQVLKLIEEVVSYSPAEFIQHYLKDEFYANYLFKKELPKSTIKDKIINFIDKSIQKYNIQSIIDDIKSLKKALEECEEDGFCIIDDEDENKRYPSYEFDSLKEEDEETTRFYKYLRELLTKIQQDLLYLEALVVDGYLLARVFKKFNIDVEDETKQRLTDETYKPHNIVIYAGDLHSKRYRQFFKELGFELIAITGKDWRDKDSKNPYNNCISMEGFPQPFFSYHEKVNWLEDVSSVKKPYKNKNWVKRESTRTKGLYYYSDSIKQINQFNRPVDYSSGEDDMQEEYIPEEYIPEEDMPEEDMPEYMPEYMPEEEVNLSSDKTLPRRSPRLKQTEGSISKKNTNKGSKTKRKTKYKQVVYNSEEDDMQEQ